MLRSRIFNIIIFINLTIIAITAIEALADTTKVQVVLDSTTITALQDSIQSSMSKTNPAYNALVGAIGVIIGGALSQIINFYTQRQRNEHELELNRQQVQEEKNKHLKEQKLKAYIDFMQACDLLAFETKFETSEDYLKHKTTKEFYQKFEVVRLVGNPDISKIAETLVESAMRMAIGIENTVFFSSTDDNLNVDLSKQKTKPVNLWVENRRAFLTKAREDLNIGTKI